MISIDDAREFYIDADTAHDFNHVLRVTRMAEHIAQVEGADLDIVRAAALLHDIARLEEDQSGEGDHAEIAAKRAREVLLWRGNSSERADAVAHAIAAHRYRGTVQPETLEAKILFDADKLDSIGAVGIARSYAIAGSLKQPLWSEAARDAVATRDQHSDPNHSPTVEYMVKLRHVPDRVFTATAKKIAAERHEYMSQFFERLGREMRGEF